MKRRKSLKGWEVGTLASIQATTKSTERDEYLIRTAEPVNLSGWITVLVLVVVILGVFGEPIYRGITS